MNNVVSAYRHTIKGKVTIIETNQGKYVLKEKKDGINIKGLYSYLKSRGFVSYPEIIDDSRRQINVYEYIEDTEMPAEQKASDLINLVTILHHKTSYFKEVNADKYKEIYENIISNINYYKNYYDNLFEMIFKEKYMSPSKYLFIKNYYKIKEVLDFCEAELENWYDIVKDEKKERVSIVHNNLSIKHFLKADEDKLVSWDNYKIDTPILDIVQFYKNDYLNLEFSQILNYYDSRFPLSKQEKKLMFILISLPDKITFDLKEFENTKNIRRKLDYIFKTESLIKPYYSKNEEEE